MSYKTTVRHRDILTRGESSTTCKLTFTITHYVTGTQSNWQHKHIPGNGVCDIEILTNPWPYRAQVAVADWVKKVNNGWKCFQAIVTAAMKRAAYIHMWQNERLTKGQDGGVLEGSFWKATTQSVAIVQIKNKIARVARFPGSGVVQTYSPCITYNLN